MISKRNLIWTLVIIINLMLSRCGLNEKAEKHERAKGKAEFIMENLGKQDLTTQFPEKYFPRNELARFLEGLTKKCDFNTKKGKYVDFFSMNEKGKNRTAFIYEYILDCDSLRFIYTYDLDAGEPELYHFEIEGIEQKNPMIIDPRKQLLYREQ